MALAVDAKYAISEEGANLSHLEEEATETEKLILSMLQEKFESAKAKDEQKAKDQARNEKMLTHERNMLARQDKRGRSNSTDSQADDDSDCSDNLDVKGKKPRPVKAPSTAGSSPENDFDIQILNCLKDDPRIVEIEIAERRQKLDDAAADRAHSREIELRRVQAEERVSLERSKADLERSKADYASATAQQMMMEFFTRNMAKQH